jgi:NAD(P)-dependent dehydrogenase (short-subunit alcohol dehydrogenase family)
MAMYVYFVYSCTGNVAHAVLPLNNYDIELTMITTSPYYSISVWGAFSGVAAVYSILSHAALGCLHPFGARVQNVLPEVPQSSEPRVVVVTGSNTGIGLETAKALAERGFTVIMACRSRDKAIEAIDHISASDRAIFVHPLDLSCQESIKAFAKAVAEKYDHIDILINNAGRNTSGKGEGDLDLCFQTNFLGHFVLTQQLMPLLLKAKKGRIVNLASVMHHYCNDAKVHDYTYWKGCARYGCEPVSTYSPSKLAAVLFTVALRKKYPQLSSIVVNPGSVNSDIWRHFPRFIIPLLRLIFLTTKQGSSCSVAAATLPDDNLPLYLQPYWMPVTSERTPHPIFETLGPYAGYVPTSPRLPSDGGAFEAEALWQASEELTGCMFPNESG